MKNKLHENSEHMNRPANQKKRREDMEAEEILILRAENEKLKNELADTLETVDIFKQVIADYSSKKNR